MSRPTHLLLSALVLVAAALFGVAAANWRNRADLQSAASLADSSARPAYGTERSRPPRDEIAAMERGRQRQEDLLEDAGVISRRQQEHIHLADEHGKVTDWGLEQAGVPLDQKGQVQAALDVAWTRILASMKERVQADERNSDAANGVRAYLIPAQDGLREEILGQLETDLAKTFGKDKAALLTGGLNPATRFGYFGRQTIMVRISPAPDGQGQQADFATYDPITGNRVLSHTARDPEQFRIYFGDAIEW